MYRIGIDLGGTNIALSMSQIATNSKGTLRVAKSVYPA